MAEFSARDVPKFSTSHDLFSDITADERFPTLPEEELAKLRGKNQNQNTSKSTKTWLKFFNGWKVQRNEARKLEDIPCHELDAILCRFFAEIRKKGRSRLRTRKFGCHAVLVRPSFEKLWQKLQYFARSWICKLEATTVEVKAREFRAQGYRKRKNASYALSEADDHFLWSSAILVCLSLRIIAWLSSAQ